MNRQIRNYKTDIAEQVLYYVVAGMIKNASFENREVSWIVDGISVYGTLTQPKDTDSCPAVVFVAGSGPTDRDWCSPLLPGKNGSAKLLAEALARNGFTSLRYDKRGSGPHVQENIQKLIGKISMQSHVDELSGAVNNLISGKHVKNGNLFVLTNSEGAIHALNYQLQAKNNRFKGLILTGAPGRSIGQIARSQIQNQIKSLPNAELLMKQYDAAITAFTRGEPVKPDNSLPDGLQKLLLGLSNPANLPFARELWTFNPSEFIAKIHEAILVLIGKKDIQVDWQADGSALQTATVDKSNVTFVYPKDANHVLKHEEKFRESLVATEVGLRYNAEDAVLDQEASTAILDWLKKQTQPPKDSNSITLE